MKCYKCGSRLAPNLNVCSKCGQDVRVYKKIIKTANAYYNLGLSKAGVRDLTGASTALRTCLSLDKKNIHARNLLGLIYMEMGESAMALREWVISRNIQARNNPAERYLKEVQANSNRLEELDQNTKKYNLALKYAQGDGKDLAIIQLKKVVAANPKMVCAQLLLGLLYMRDGKYDRAERTLKAALKVDCGNTTANRYLAELKVLRREGGVEEEKQEEAVRTLSNQEVIVPMHTKAVSSYLMTMLYVFIGIVLGAGILYYVLMPSVHQSYANEFNSQVAVYEQQAQQNEAEVDSLNGQIEELNDQIEDLQVELSQYVQSADDADQEHLTIVEAYDMTIEMLRYFYTGDYISVANYCDKLAEDTIDSDSYRQAYDYVMVQNYQTMYETCLNSGITAYQQYNYQQGIELLEAAVKFNPDSTQAMLYLGVCYHASGDKTTADIWYNKIIEEYPDSAEVEAATKQRDG